MTPRLAPEVLADTGTVKIHPRRPLTTKQRAELFALRGGVCHLCKGKIKVGEAWDDEHVLPLSMGGSNDLDNRDIAHAKCHRGPGGKSAREATARAKADRIRAKHSGTAPPPLQRLKSRGFPKRWDR